MDIINFTPMPAAAGGALIGLSAAIMLALHGRITGISGILAGSLNTQFKENLWRIIFLLGLIIGSFLGIYFKWGPQDITITSSKMLIVTGGLLVGFGTTLGGGCTSGHGVCGLSRLSKRSIFATIIFMTTAILVVTIKKFFF